MYKKIDTKDLNYFSSFLKTENILYGEGIDEIYSKDELGTVSNFPEVVLKVETSLEISKIMKYANENKIAVVVRGSGTGLVGSCVPLCGGIVIDMTKMNKIIGIDEENLVLEVEPGVLLMDIYSYVEPRGYFYAPDPGEKSATIGGNISTNAGGMRAVKYGTTRDWVLALEVVLPNGEITTFGRKVVKDSTGYSLKNLIIGSEGTLAIITKAYLKLMALPEKTMSLLVPFETMEKGIESVPKILKNNLGPTAIEFFERTAIKFSEEYLGKKFPDSKNNAYILLTFDGTTDDEVKAKYQKAAELCINELHAEDALIVDTQERKESVWNTRGSFLEAIKSSTTEMDECDVVVPRAEVSDFIKYTYELAKEYEIRIPSFGHAGDGNLHIYICKDELPDAIYKERLKKVFEKMYERASEVGGLVSGEHGIGYAKKEYMRSLLGDSQMQIMKGIKMVFDPNSILNPGKLF